MGLQQYKFFMCCFLHIRHLGDDVLEVHPRIDIMVAACGRQGGDDAHIAGGSVIDSGLQERLHRHPARLHMFLYMAEKAGHYWLDMLDLSKVGLTGSKLQLAKGGAYNSKYRITVPKELNDYE